MRKCPCPACFATAQHGAVQRAYFFDATQDTGQPHAFVLGNTALPATFPFQRDQVEPLCHAVSGTLQVIVDHTGYECTRNRSLFKDVARVMRREGFEHALQLARFVDNTAQVCSGDFFAIALPQHRAIDALLDQIFIHRGLVLEVHLGLAARHFVERRLRDVEITPFNQLWHLAEKERQQQGTDVRTVDIRVGHDDDLVIAQLVDVELVTANTCAQRHNKVANFLAAQHPVKTRAFDIQDLTLQRQDRLRTPVAARLGRTTRRVTLHQEDFGFGGVFFRAIFEFGRVKVHIHRRLAPDFTGLAGRFTCGGGLDDLRDDRFGHLRVLFEPFVQLFTHQVFDRGADF